MSRPIGWPLLELLADLAEELEVVVDLLDVLALAAELLVEVLDDLLVDVERPVGERPVADRRLRVVDRRRPSPSPSPRACEAVPSIAAAARPAIASRQAASRRARGTGAGQQLGRRTRGSSLRASFATPWRRRTCVAGPRRAGPRGPGPSDSGSAPSVVLGDDGELLAARRRGPGTGSRRRGTRRR